MALRDIEFADDHRETPRPQRDTDRRNPDGNLKPSACIAVG